MPIKKSKQKVLHVNLERVIPNDKQIHKLFYFLESRSHFISHKDMPEYSGHEEFVQTVRGSGYRFSSKLSSLSKSSVVKQNDDKTSAVK